MSLKKWRKNIPFQFSPLSQNAVQWSFYHIKEKRISQFSVVYQFGNSITNKIYVEVNVHVSFLSFTELTFKESGQSSLSKYRNFLRYFFLLFSWNISINKYVSMISYFGHSVKFLKPKLCLLCDAKEFYLDFSIST